jgi:hypothetical protein
VFLSSLAVFLGRLLDRLLPWAIVVVLVAATALVALLLLRDALQTSDCGFGCPSLSSVSSAPG